MKILEQLQRIDEELERERQRKLYALCDRIQSAVLNIPCDLSATAPEHHTGHRSGHKQARHGAAEIIAEMFVAELEGK